MRLKFEDVPEKDIHARIIHLPEVKDQFLENILKPVSDKFNCPLKVCKRQQCKNKDTIREEEKSCWSNFVGDSS